MTVYLVEYRQADGSWLARSTHGARGTAERELAASQQIGRIREHHALDLFQPKPVKASLYLEREQQKLA